MPNGVLGESVLCEGFGGVEAVAELGAGYRAVRGVREEAEYGVAVVCQLGYFGLEGGLDAHIGVGQFVSLSVGQFPRALPRG